MITGFDAIILAGGRGSRLGGLRKPELSVGGRRLLDLALAAAAGADLLIVVGDAEVPSGVRIIREEPAYSGPVVAAAAGFDALASHSPWTLLLASDLPDVGAAVACLLAAEPDDRHDGACLVDAGGRLQWLLGCYRSDVLGARLAERGDVRALYRLLEPLRLLAVDPGAASVDDIDTPDDVARWQATGKGPA